MNTNVNTPTQTAIAQALGIARSRVTAMKQQGMPTHSIQAARAWRQANLDPCRTKDFTRQALQPRAEPPIELSRKLRDAMKLADTAADALEAGVFWAVVPGLQFAMKCLSEQEREQFTMPVAVWDELTREMAATIADANADTINPSDHRPELGDAECDAMGDFWYEVAMGQWTINKPPLHGAAVAQ